MVGSLLYASIATRPDIAQAVEAVSKFNSCPTEAHLTAVKRIFRYLKGSINLGIKYERSADNRLVGFSDADWAGDMDERLIAKLGARRSASVYRGEWAYRTLLISNNVQLIHASLSQVKRLI